MARQLVIELVGEASKYVKSLDEAEKASKGFGDRVDSVGKKMTAFVSVPIVGFLGASTKAAMDDAAAQAHLEKTLSNTIGSSKGLTDQVNDYIEKAQKASTFTDDELRPAFELFATTTKNLEESQQLTNIAMDVAAAKGISLEQAATAVAKAHEGQFAAANKLVPGLIDVKDETLSVDQVTAKLASTFNGQAIAATETTAGKMQNLKRDLGEASEAMGAKLLPVMADFASFATDTLLPALDKISGGNGAFVLLAAAAAGPVLSNIVKLKGAIDALNLSLDATSIKAAAALGALGIVIKGGQIVMQDIKEKGVIEGILGPSPLSRKLDDFFRASGGPVSPRTPYIVGEKGPELFVPTAAGAIVANQGNRPAGMGRMPWEAATGGYNQPILVQVILDNKVIGESAHDYLLAKQRRTPLGLTS